MLRYQSLQICLLLLNQRKYSVQISYSNYIYTRMSPSYQEFRKRIAVNPMGFVSFCRRHDLAPRNYFQYFPQVLKNIAENQFKPGINYDLCLEAILRRVKVLLPCQCGGKYQISYLSEIVKPIWITLMRVSDSENYIEQFSCLKKHLGFNPEFVDYLLGECVPFGFKVSEKLVSQACNFFNLNKSEARIECVVDWAVGNCCLEGLYIFINAFIFEFNHTSERKQNQGVHESVMIALHHSKKIGEQISTCLNSSEYLVSLFDLYFQKVKEGENEICFNFLKTICLMQALHNHGIWNHNKAYERVQKELLQRWLHVLYSDCDKVRVLIFEWILYGGVWDKITDKLKSSLFGHLIAIGELNLTIRSLSEDFSEGKRYFQCQKFWYIDQILVKYQDQNFYKRLPQYYELAEPLLLARKQQKTSKLLKEHKSDTRTLTLEKFDQATQSEQLSLSKIRQCIFRLTENVQMEKIYIYMIIVLKNLEQQEEQDYNSDCLKKSPMMKLFYRVRKAITQYQQIFGNNRLTSEIMGQICKLTATYNLDSTLQTKKQTYPDLGFCQSPQLHLEGISDCLFAQRPIFFHFLAIYKVYRSEVKFHSCEANSQKGTIAEKGKNGVQKSEAGPLQQMEEALCSLIRIACNSHEKVQFLMQILSVRDTYILNTLYLNLIYFLIRMKKSKQKQEVSPSIINIQAEIRLIFRNLISFYLIPNEWCKFEGAENQLILASVKKIILTAHRQIENWKQYRRDSSKNHLERKSITPLTNAQSISQYLWEILIGSSQLTDLIHLSREYEKINFIKESIYLMQMYHRRLFPCKATPEQIQYLFSLHKKLDSHLDACQGNVIQKLGLSFQQKRSTQEIRCEKWKNYLMNIVCNRQSSGLTLSQIVGDLSSELADLEQTEQIDHVIHTVTFCTTFANFLWQNQSLTKLKSLLRNLNNWKISQEVISILLNKIHSFPAPTISQIKQLKWDQLLIFRKHEEIDHLLRFKKPEKMALDQLRAAVIFYHKIGNYDYARLFYQAIQKGKIESATKQYLQELQIYKIQATYKSVLVYPAEKMIVNIDNIVERIRNDAQPNNPLTLQQTKPFYQAYRFFCENYSALTPKQEYKMLDILNKFVKIALRCCPENPHHSEVIIQGMYFLLKFWFTQCQSLSGEGLLSYHGSIIEPHRDFLINNISENQNKNSILKRLLEKIARYNQSGSVWWISSMILQNIHKEEKGSKSSEALDKIIAQMGRSIEHGLRGQSNELLRSQLDWIKWFREVKPGEQMREIPKKLKSPFSDNTILLSISSLSGLGTGKSKPILITFKIERNGVVTYCKFIRKSISDGWSGWKTESSTANFFKSCGLVDKDVTYSIVHLSKYCILIEYIGHLGTLDQLLLKQIDYLDKKKIFGLNESRKNNLKAYMGAFDYLEQSPIKYQLDKFFLSDVKNVKEWWNKYLNFVKTYAQWAFIGYVVGLGDRHTNNILIAENGKVIQIDFQYIFDAGKILGFPEWVLFRFTRALARSLSVIEPYGLFYSEMVKTAQRYQSQKRTFWRALSHFSYFKKRYTTAALCERATLKDDPYTGAKQLIQQATDKLLLRDMFFGWGSYK